MRASVTVVVVLLSVSGVAQSPLPAEGVRFTKVGYLGGAPGVTRRTPAENVLVVSPSIIRLEIKNGPVVEVNPSTVEVLEYAGMRKAPTWDTVGAGIAFPPSLLSLLGGVNNHYIVIEHRPPAGAGKAGLMIMGNKDNYIDILQALTAATSLAAKGMAAPK
jgi:hypothetical protein